MHSIPYLTGLRLRTAGQFVNADYSPQSFQCADAGGYFAAGAKLKGRHSIPCYEAVRQYQKYYPISFFPFDSENNGTRQANQCFPEGRKPCVVNSVCYSCSKHQLIFRLDLKGSYHLRTCSKAQGMHVIIPMIRVPQLVSQFSDKSPVFLSHIPINHPARRYN